MKAKTNRKPGSGGKRAGAGRKRGEPMTRITVPVRIHPEVVAFVASFPPVSRETGIK